MEIGRKSLPHMAPLSSVGESEGEVYFVTICCLPRGVNQLANSEVWAGILEAVEFRETRGDLKVKLLLAMPDHLHGLLMFPRGGMVKILSDMKRWWAVKHDIRWQRDFFDHRLRSWESAVEKGNYIRMNPVRAGLVETIDAWQFLIDWR